MKKVIIEAEKILLKLISIDTRSSINNETEAALYIAEQFDSISIPRMIIEEKKGKGNIIGWIDGNHPDKKPLLLLSHLDTADNGDITKWRFAPQKGTLYNGKIYGRGAIDCKGLTALHLSIMKKIRQLDTPPDRTIIMVGAASEEQGGVDGILKVIEKMPGINNCALVLSEGGGFPLQIRNNKYITCQTGEAGIPEALDYCGSLKERYMKKISLLSFLCDSLVFSLLIKQKIFSSKRKINIRYLGDCFKHPDNYKINITSRKNSFYQIIADSVHQFYDGAQLIPHITEGFSDNRFFREKGIPVYGFFPLSMNDSLNGIHGENEFISFNTLLKAERVFFDIVKKLSYKRRF